MSIAAAAYLVETPDRVRPLARTPVPASPREALADALGHLEHACTLLEPHRHLWDATYDALRQAGLADSHFAARIACLMKAADHTALTRDVLRSVIDVAFAQ